MLTWHLLSLKYVVAEKYVLDITQCSKKRGKKEKQIDRHEQYKEI